MANILVRRAQTQDAEALLHLIEALAHYEKLTPPDEAAKTRLMRDMFGEKPRLDAFLAEVDGVPAGYTLVFETYSSFLALPTLFLEDFFVLPAYRSQKIGSALFRAMVAEAKQRGCGRMEWSVLDWNRLAIDFYERKGARRMHEWFYYRLLPEDMDRLLAGE